MARPSLLAFLSVPTLVNCTPPRGACTAQAVHAVEPSTNAYRPVGHDSQAEAADWLAIMPTGQASHCLAPALALNVPGTQSAHCADPGDSAKWPGSHALHAEAAAPPVVGLKVPGAHAAQATAPDVSL